MGQPVKLSDALVLDARQVSEYTARSIAGQIEYWANLGRAMHKVLQGAQALALCRSARAQPLSSCLESIDSEQGRKRVADFLESQPFPHYESAPDRTGFLIRTQADGTRTVGRFVNRQFKEVDEDPGDR